MGVILYNCIALNVPSVGKFDCWRLFGICHIDLLMDVGLTLKRCTDAGMGMTTQKMMSPQPQTEADSLEMTYTVQTIEMSHSAVDAHHSGREIRKLVCIAGKHFDCTIYSAPKATMQVCAGPSFCSRARWKRAVNSMSEC